MRLSKLVGAGVGFIAGSVLSGFFYSLIPADISANITSQNFAILCEVVGAYVGYTEF